MKSEENPFGRLKGEASGNEMREREGMSNRSRYTTMLRDEEVLVQESERVQSMFNVARLGLLPRYPL